MLPGPFNLSSSCAVVVATPHPCQIPDPTHALLLACIETKHSFPGISYQQGQTLAYVALDLRIDIIILMQRVVIIYVYVHLWYVQHSADLRDPAAGNAARPFGPPLLWARRGPEDLLCLGFRV